MSSFRQRHTRALSIAPSSPPSTMVRPAWWLPPHPTSHGVPPAAYPRLGCGAAPSQSSSSNDAPSNAAPLVAAWSLQPFPPPHRAHRSRAPICSLDSLFTEQTAELNRQLDLPGEESEASRSISALHDTSIAPLLPAVWSSEFQDRKDAIIKLSTGLDELEASSSGPLLTGDAFASCDAQCFPTFCLLSWALPRHFGWEEYTTDALFWKRPRLHAWFDLCSYEKPCRDAAAKIERELEAIEYWPEISVDVPTNKLRKRVRKDL